MTQTPNTGAAHNNPGALKRAALRYADTGWPVFPCAPNSKVPLTMHGLRDATTDVDVITWWWDQNPYANVAIATGAPGPDVVDVDTKHGAPGLESRSRLARAGLLRGAFAEIITGTGGQHLYYPGTTQRCTVDRRTGIDFRGQGGYVIAPPSIVDGRDYWCHDIARMSHGRPVDVAAIKAYLTPPRPPRREPATPAQGSVTGVIQWMAGQAAGERNQSLYWAACRLVENGATEADYTALAHAARGTGLDDHEIDRTISSARSAVTRC